MRTGRVVLHRSFFLDTGWTWTAAKNFYLRIWTAHCDGAFGKPKPPDADPNLRHLGIRSHLLRVALPDAPASWAAPAAVQILFEFAEVLLQAGQGFIARAPGAGARRWQAQFFSAVAGRRSISLGRRIMGFSICDRII